MVQDGCGRSTCNMMTVKKDDAFIKAITAEHTDGNCHCKSSSGQVLLPAFRELKVRCSPRGCWETYTKVLDSGDKSHVNQWKAGCTTCESQTQDDCNSITFPDLPLKMP